MINRILEFLVVTLWLVSMTWLIARDAVPRWFAEEPPQAASLAWLDEVGREFQYGIYDPQSGLRKGACWSVYEVNGDTIARRDLLALDHPGFVRDLVIDSSLTFLDETELTAVDVEISGLPTRIELKGERQGPQFAFELKIGAAPGYEFVLDAQAARTLCDVIKPFSALRGLEVGRSWKIYPIDPLSFIGEWRRAKPAPILVTVTSREIIQNQGQQRECFVVESPGARAWVEPNGVVLKQVVTLPAIGQLEIHRQAFQRNQYEQTLRRLRGL